MVAEVAVQYDLGGVSNAEIADYLDYVDAEQDYRDRSHSAYRRVRYGRRLLWALGAWPWAVIPDGVLPARWYEIEDFAHALAAWHREAVEMAINDTLVAVDSITRRQEMRVDGDRLDAASTIYRERLRRAS